MEDKPMYDQLTFQFAKQDLVTSLLQKPDTFVKQAKVHFIRHLLTSAAINGVISQQDVEYAIFIAYSHFMAQTERDECLSWMNYHGSRYIGELSRDQQGELQLLCELCDHLTINGDLSALQQIADLLD
jgi:hypothetical protein